MLPLLLYLLRRSPWWPIAMVIAAVSIRVALYAYRGEIQSLAYWSIVGRFDQFAIGMVAFHFSAALAARRAWFIAVGIATTLHRCSQGLNRNAPRAGGIE